MTQAAAFGQYKLSAILYGSHPLKGFQKQCRANRAKTVQKALEPVGGII